MGIEVGLDRAFSSRNANSTNKQFQRETAGISCLFSKNAAALTSPGEVYWHKSSDGQRICEPSAGEPKMPLDFYMLFASATHGNAIDNCCACGKGKEFGQSAWQYLDLFRGWGTGGHVSELV